MLGIKRKICLAAKSYTKVVIAVKQLYDVLTDPELVSGLLSAAGPEVDALGLVCIDKYSPFMTPVTGCIECAL